MVTIKEMLQNEKKQLETIFKYYVSATFLKKNNYGHAVQKFGHQTGSGFIFKHFDRKP